MIVRMLGADFVEEIRQAAATPAIKGEVGHPAG